MAASSDSVHQSIGAFARKTPDVFALAETDGSGVTYRELLRRVDAIGAMLRGSGVRQNERVAIVLRDGDFERVARALLEAPDDFDNFPVVRLNENGTLPPLFFLHGLGEDRPLCLLRPHGVDGKAASRFDCRHGCRLRRGPQAPKPRGPSPVGTAAP